MGTSITGLRPVLSGDARTCIYNIYYSQAAIYCYSAEYILRLQIAKQWPLTTSLLSDEIRNEFSKLVSNS